MIKIEQNKTLNKTEQLNKIVKYIEKIMNSNEFGILKISFENGNIVNIKLEKNLKLKDI